jgi:hypothetical protein
MQRNIHGHALSDNINRPAAQTDYAAASKSANFTVARALTSVPIDGLTCRCSLVGSPQSAASKLCSCFRRRNGGAVVRQPKVNSA